MNRTPLTLLAAIALAATGCGRDNSGSVALSQLCYPPTPDTQTGACVLPPTCSPILANGDLWVDLATSGNTLEYPIELLNERPSNADVASGRTDTNFALIEEFRLRYVSAGLTLPRATSVQTIKVPTMGTTVAMVRVIPSVAGAAIGQAVGAGPALVVAYVSAHGHFGDGNTFDTPEFQVPISVTVGQFGPYTCPTGKTLVGVCPQQGQTAVATCQ